MKKIDWIHRIGIQKAFIPWSGIGSVLMFHRICEENSNNYDITRGLQVTPEHLELIIRLFISRNIDIISPHELNYYLSEKKNRKKFIVFTFDDGYVDNYTTALPIFEKFNVPFTIFISTGFPDNTAILWWYYLEEHVKNNHQIDFFYNDKYYFYKIKTIDEKWKVYGKLRDFILDSDAKSILPKLKAIFNNEEKDFFYMTRKLALNWKQIKELSNHPLVTIGAHTINHLALSKLEKNEVINEISGSVNRLQNQTGKKILYFAYPIGTKKEANEHEYKIAGECGIKVAFTAEKGNIYKNHRDHLLSLPRIGINENWKPINIDLYIDGITPFRDKIKKILP